MVEKTVPKTAPAKFDPDLIIKLHSTLVANGSQGCHITELVKNFKTDWSKDLKKEAVRHGYSNVLDMLRDMPEEVSVVENRVIVIEKEITKSTVDLVDKSVDPNKKKNDPPRPVSGFNGFFNRPNQLKANSAFSGFYRRPDLFQLSANDVPLQPSNANGFGRRCINSNGFNPFERNQGLQQPAGQVPNQLDPRNQARANGFPSNNDFGDFDPSYSSPEPVEEEGDYYGNNERLGEEGSEYGSPDEDKEGSYQLFESNENYYSADEFESLDYTEDLEPCNELMTEEIPPIPPKLYRLVNLLKQHGGELSKDRLETEYKKVYNLSLNITELRKVLGVEDNSIRITKMAFARCPLASLFRYRQTGGGVGMVALAGQNSSDDKGSIAGSSCLDQSIGIASVSGMNNRFSRMSLCSLTSTSHRTSITPTSRAAAVPVDIPSTIPTTSPPARKLASDLSETATCLLSMASIAHDLARQNQSITLHGLFQELKNIGPCYAPFTRSHAQLVGLLLKYFEKCFTITCDEKSQIHICHTGVCPKDVMECLEGVPRRICDLPWPDKNIHSATQIEAILVHYDGSFPERLNFNFHVGTSSREVYDYLKATLSQYDHLLRDLGEPFMAKPQINQLCLYRGLDQQLVRCRVVCDAAKLVLQNIDTGERVLVTQLDVYNIFHLPTQMNIDRFPPMAAHACFLHTDIFKNVDNKFEKMQNILKRLIQKKKSVNLVIFKVGQQKQNNNFCKLFKVKLMVDGNTYPDDLLLL